MNRKQIRMLQLLDNKVKNCNECSLRENGKVIPFWTWESKYAIIGEAPGYNEVMEGRPFVGDAGKILTNILTKLEFKAKDFFIINTCQCRPVKGVLGKPTNSQMVICRNWVRKYLKIINPEKILCLGNYAKSYFTGNIYGIMRERGEIRNYKLDENTKEYPVLFTVHPASIIYNSQMEDFLLKDLTLFKEMKSNEFIKEDEFSV